MGLSDHRVAIVGGGPVGLGLAVELGIRGISCFLVERREHPQQIPKGQNLTQRTMEHFRHWGVEREIRAARVMPKGYPNGGVTAYRNLMSGYSFPWWQRSTVNDFYFARNERVPQYETERVLRDRVASLESVEALYGWSATGIDQDDDAVTLEIANDSGSRTLNLDWLVGCDGSHSTVRALTGITEDRSDHDRRMVLAVFRSRDLSRIVSGFGEISFFKILDPALDGYWKFLGRVDADETWFFHAPVDEGASHDPEEVAAVLHEAVGTLFRLELDHVGYWDLRIALARSYRRGRLFIAGDAAHSHPPYGGYGINTGFEDVRNLGWKLAAAIEGWAGEALLDSYQLERLPVFKSTASDFIEAFIRTDREFLAAYAPEEDREEFERAWEERRANAGSGVADFEPHYEGSPLISGLDGGVTTAVGEHRFRARPGHHLPPAELTGDRDLFVELGTGFALIALEARSANVAPWREAAADLGIPLSVVEDTRAGTRARYEARMILVRPDHYVAWAGDEISGDEAMRTLGRALGHATARTRASSH
jgi:2-polyprenyl-6-methoxyphenol hydroxylase-like FAD-dependent oxidoreductase